VVRLLPGESWDGTTPLVPLAELALDNHGTVTVGPGTRQYAGVRLAGPNPDAAELRALGSGAVSVNTALTIGRRARPDAPQALTVDGGIYLQDGGIQSGGDPLTTSDLGLYSQVETRWMRLVTTAAPIRFFTDGGAGSVARLTVEPGGEVGVGTSPQAWLDVTGAADGAGPPSLQLRSGNGSDRSDAVQVALGYDGGSQYRHTIRSRHNSGSASENALDFYVWAPTTEGGPDGLGASHVLSLDGGNVGIGTTSPENGDGWSRVLDVLGTGHAKLSVRTASGIDARVLAHENGFHGSQPGMIVGTASNHPLSLVTSGATRMSVDVDGKVGINGPATQFMMTVSANYAQLLLRRDASLNIGGTQTFLQLYQEALTDPAVLTRPSILFHHQDKFWKRIECANDGFHLREGADSEGYSDLRVQNLSLNGQVNGDLFVTGRLCFQGFGGWKNIQNQATGAVVAIATPGPSDARLKTAVRPITDALQTVLKLTGLRYRWAEAGLDHLTRDVADSVSAGPGATEEEHRRVRDAEVARARAALVGDDIGLIAQDVERVVPEVVHDGPEGYKHIRYGQLTALLVEAVKEQQTTIERLAGRLDALARVGEEH
jgi:hypothetical protein